MQMMSSMPLSANVDANSLYRGRWVEEHVGVNAPGSEKTTTFFPLNRSLEDTCFQLSPSLSGKVHVGTCWPSLFCSMDVSLTIKVNTKSHICVNDAYTSHELTEFRHKKSGEYIAAFSKCLLYLPNVNMNLVCNRLTARCCRQINARCR